MPGKHKMILKNCEWCGQPFQARNDQLVKGKGRFCGRGCSAKYIALTREIPDQKGSNNPNWKGGRTHHMKGYIYQYAPDHPRQHNGYVLEHILVAEQMLGRPLTPEEVVHHKNGKKWDNRPENLRVFKNSAEHTKYHAELKRLKKGA